MNESAETFKKVISTLARASEKRFEEDHRFDSLREFLGSFDIKDAETFSCLAAYNVNNVVEEMCRKNGFSNYEIRTHVIMNYYFYESNIECIIKPIETFVCITDKSRWLIEKYLNYKENNTLPDMTIDEKCYWKPHFGSAQLWMDYIDSLHCLYYGQIEKYITCLKALQEEGFNVKNNSERGK